MSKSPADVPLQILIGHWKIFFPLIAQAWDGHDHIHASILKNLLIPNTMENQFPHKKNKHFSRNSQNFDQMQSKSS